MVCCAVYKTEWKIMHIYRAIYNNKLIMIELFSLLMRLHVHITGPYYMYDLKDHTCIAIIIIICMHKIID